MILFRIESKLFIKTLNLLLYRMSEKKDFATELINLYEKNVNEPNRKKVLDGMLSHPSGHILAMCVFQRADSSVFLSARNQSSI